MQSTGTPSMHALSLMSTQDLGWLRHGRLLLCLQIPYVWGCCPPRGFLRALLRQCVRLLILDVARRDRVWHTSAYTVNMHPSCITIRLTSYYPDGAARDLGVLCEQASSGYGWPAVDRSSDYFWAATHQQIYRTLRVMENNNWVRRI